MRKLYELKAAVEGLAKTVTTPDADLDLTVSSSLSSQSSTAFKATTDLDALLGKVIVSSCIWQDVVLAFLAFMATLACRLIIVQAVLMQYLSPFCDQDLGALRDIVINANPAQPPLTLLVLHGLLCERYRVLSTVHVHSSVATVPPQLLSCLGPRHSDSYARHMFQLGFTLIWKDGEATGIQVWKRSPVRAATHKAL